MNPAAHGHSLTLQAGPHGNLGSISQSGRSRQLQEDLSHWEDSAGKMPREAHEPCLI